MYKKGYSKYRSGTGSHSFSRGQISGTSTFIRLVNWANMCLCLNVTSPNTWRGVRGYTYLGHKECSSWGSLFWVKHIYFQSEMSANLIPGSLSQNIKPHCNLLWLMKYFQITNTEYKMVRTIAALTFVWKNEGKICTPIWGNWSLYHQHNNIHNLMCGWPCIVIQCG